MNKNEIMEYADYLLRTAMYMTENITDAEDLAQDTLVAGLVAIKEKKNIDNPKSWLTAVLNRKYYDVLRRKYRKPVVSIDAADEIPVCDNIAVQIEQSEDAENIRRCLAQLTELYRHVMVRYYMHGENVKQIAASLDIPENTVKARLYTGRKHIRKEFAMENYTKQSYEPESLFISISGNVGINNEPFSLVSDDKIKMNLLILAYEKPVTIPELAKGIGIPTAYIEPTVNELVGGELMKRVGDKVYSDFIIFDENDRTANTSIERELADKHFKEIWEIVRCGLDELHNQDYCKRLTASAREKLDSFFAVRAVKEGINNIIAKKAGEYDYENCPDRPNGGKWFAMGSRYSYDYDWSGTYWYKQFYIDGEYSWSLDNYENLKMLTFTSYDTMLGKTYHGWSDIKYVKHPMKDDSAAKMLYAIYSDKENLLPVIDARCFENIDGLIKLGLLARSESGKVTVDVPVIKMNDRWDICRLSEKYGKEISDKFGCDFEKLLDNPVKLPAHLKSVPEFQMYMKCWDTVVMMIIMNAHENGLFFANRNLEENPAPAIFIATEE